MTGMPREEKPVSFESSGVRSAEADEGFASGGRTLLAIGFEVGSSAATAATRGEAVGGVGEGRGEAVGGVDRELVPPLPPAPSAGGGEGTREAAAEGLPL